MKLKVEGQEHINVYYAYQDESQATAEGVLHRRVYWLLKPTAEQAGLVLIHYLRVRKATVGNNQVPGIEGAAHMAADLPPTAVPPTPGATDRIAAVGASPASLTQHDSGAFVLVPGGDGLTAMQLAHDLEFRKQPGLDTLAAITNEPEKCLGLLMADGRVVPLAQACLPAPSHPQPVAAATTPTHLACTTSHKRPRDGPEAGTARVARRTRAGRVRSPSTAAAGATPDTAPPAQPQPHAQPQAQRQRQPQPQPQAQPTEDAATVAGQADKSNEDSLLFIPADLLPLPFQQDMCPAWLDQLQQAQGTRPLLNTPPLSYQSSQEAGLGGEGYLVNDMLTYDTIAALLDCDNRILDDKVPQNDDILAGAAVKDSSAGSGTYMDMMRGFF